MNLKQSSLTLRFFNWIADVSQSSVSARFWRSILNIWDKLVSGSIALNWVTGKDYIIKIASKKPSLFATRIHPCWCSFLKFIRDRFISDKSFSKSRYIAFLYEFGTEIATNPFSCVGWFGSSFIGVYGILRLQFVGISKTMLFLIVVLFVFFMLIIFTKASLSRIICNSWILARLDEIDD